MVMTIVIMAATMLIIVVKLMVMAKMVVVVVDMMVGHGHSAGQKPKENKNCPPFSLTYY